MKERLFPKVKALYGAVLELIGEDVDIRDVKVSDITSRAGIGKGTAYEYFSNKEEIICSALLYHIDQISSQMMAGINGMEDFSGMICYLLECMEREIPKRDCLVQFIRLLADNGPVGRLLQKEMREKDGGICTPQALIDYIIQAGIRQGVIGKRFPLLYMRMAIMSKLLVYSFYLMSEEASHSFEKGQMHRILCEGLLKELG